jgi:predicted RNase H-like HicB family nuclease
LICRKLKDLRIRMILKPQTIRVFQYIVIMTKYEVIIYWSQTDQVFIAEMPELKGCMAHGDTPDEALKEVYIMAEEWRMLAKEKGWQIPEPKGRLMYA